LLLAFAAAVFSSPVVREAMAQRHPRPLSVVLKEVAERRRRSGVAVCMAC
jgi:hypothetical protein